MKRMGFWICLAMVLVEFTSCAGLRQTMERPRINIANVRPREIKLFEQVFDLELRILNPNDAPLPINGLAFDLELNEKRFATGVSSDSITVDRFGSAVVHVQAVTTFWGFLRQVADLQQTRTPRVTYRIKGIVYSGSPRVKIPFEDSGEFSIPIDLSK